MIIFKVEIHVSPVRFWPLPPKLTKLAEMWAFLRPHS